MQIVNIPGRSFTSPPYRDTCFTISKTHAASQIKYIYNNNKWL